MSCRRPKLQIKPKVGLRSSLRSTPNKSDSTEDTSISCSTESQSLELTQSSNSSEVTLSSSQTSNDNQNKDSVNQNNNTETTSAPKRTVDESIAIPIETKKKKIQTIEITVYDPNQNSIPDKTTNASNNLTVKEKESSPKESTINTKNVTQKTSIDGSTLTTKFIPVLVEESDESTINKNLGISQNDNENEKADDLKNNNQVINRKQRSIPISNPTNQPNSDSVSNETTIATNEKNSELEKQKEIKSLNLSKMGKEIIRKRKTTKMRSQTDKTKMTMKDLIIYNPPLTEEQKEQRKYDSESEKSGNEIPNITDKTLKQNETQESTKASDNPKGPRVKVGADGGLILDEESVIVKRKKNDTLEPAVIETAKTTSACTNYSSFRTRTTVCHKPRWNEHETVRFYSALNFIGTDFTLMSSLFFKGKRSRLDLRNKFKKEEKANKLMIDEALSSPNTFMNQCEELKDLLDDSSSDDSDQETEDKTEDKTDLKKDSIKESEPKNKVKVK